MEASPDFLAKRTHGLDASQQLLVQPKPGRARQRQGVLCGSHVCSLYPLPGRPYHGSLRRTRQFEARTKRGWTVRAKSPAANVVSAAHKIVYRDDFHAALLEFIDWYKDALPLDRAQQEAFIRKFDSFCQ
jgi:hypothetical protein